MFLEPLNQSKATHTKEKLINFLKNLSSTFCVSLTEIVTFMHMAIELNKSTKWMELSCGNTEVKPYMVTDLLNDFYENHYKKWM